MGRLFQSPGCLLIVGIRVIDSATDISRLALLPWPASITSSADQLRFDGTLAVEYTGVRTQRLERAVTRFQTGLRHGHHGLAEDPLRLRIACETLSADHPQLGDAEGYRLSVGAAGAVLSAQAEWGVLHGLSTLVQLTQAPGVLPFCEINDAPRFAWRGVLIDVARHFIGAATLKRTLDGMALCKLNVLHLHLTDDQAFRFPSTRFASLTSEEHFSRAELENLVRHAADLGIRIVPEIDMPGHTNCWVDAYPTWGTGETGPTRRFGVHQACLDPTSEAVYAAIEKLLGEVAEVFPDGHLHIGGDEVHPAWWSESAGVQKFMTAQAIPDISALQAHFNSRVEEIVSGLGRNAVGWDEVLHPDLSETMVVQSWRGATARDRALARGNDCVVSSNYYLDLFYPAEVHYRFDPEGDEATLIALEDALLDDARFAHVADGMRWTHQWREPAAAAAGSPGRVLGAEACLWSELVADPLLDVRLWSRLPALAERFWSPVSVTDVDDLYRRLPACQQRLARASGIDIETRSRELIAAAGVTSEWWPLVEVLEPVKWYGRLLGEEALSARIAGREMPQARPYDADTPLNRVVDALPPESMAARAVAQLCRRQLAGDRGAAAELAAFARGWQTLAGKPGCLPELAESAEVLGALGALVLEVLHGRTDGSAALPSLDAAAAPRGEYLIAVVPPLRAWMAAGAP